MDFYPKLMNYALHALGRRAMTEAEVRKKLQEKLRKISTDTNDIEVVDKVMNRLIDLRLLDDAQYVQNFIRTKNSLNPTGKKGLFFKLKNKGIDGGFFDKIWDEMEVDEESVLNKACDAFIRKKGLIDSQKQKGRLMRYLGSRGFPVSAIYKKLHEY